MIQPYIEFREPTRHELLDAQDAICESYIAGDDRYDLHRYLGEVVLDALWARAKQAKVVPNGEYWDDIVYRAALKMAAGWSTGEWNSFREGGGA